MIGIHDVRRCFRRASIFLATTFINASPFNVFESQKRTAFRNTQTFLRVCRMSKMLDNKLAIASISLGQHSSHTLPRKVKAAATKGFSGIEIIYEELEEYAKSLSTPMLNAAKRIRQICEEHAMTIIALNSFCNYEGNKSPLEERLATAKVWLDVVRALGAEYLQMPAIFIEDINDDHDLMVSELRQLADLARASEPVIKIAFENLGWSTHCYLWEHALQMVRDVDRDNFGLCLDTFHLCVRLWADAADSSNDSGIQSSGEENLRESLQRFVEKCPVERIFYIQLSDGERWDPPYSKDHPLYDPEIRPVQVWSNEARPFPLEKDFGAYMPVEAVTKAFLVDKRFSGWVSLETFDRRMKEEHNGPEDNAKRGMESWKNLRRRLIAAYQTD